MPRYKKDGKRPDLNGLLRQVATRGGLFTIQEAQKHGVSRQLLHYYVGSGQVERVRRGVYRSTLFPKSSHEEVLIEVLSAGPGALAAGPTALDIWQVGNLEPDRIYVRVPPDAPKHSHGAATSIIQGGKPVAGVVHEGIPVEPVPEAITSTTSVTHYDLSQIAEVVSEAINKGMITPASAGRMLTRDEQAKMTAQMKRPVKLGG